MTTREELEKEAKKAGVENPEEAANVSELKQTVDLKTGRKLPFYFPQHGITVLATDREAAEAELERTLKQRGNK